MEEVQIPNGAEVLDATGMTVMPGLINSNCHININALRASPQANLGLAEIKARWENTWSMMPRRAFVYLMQGVTSIRNTSGPSKRILPVKQAIEKGELPGPRIFLGGALLMSDEHFQQYIERSKTPADAIDWMRNEFAYHVISDADKDTDALLGDEFNFWKLYMSGEKYDGKNDFTDEELRFMIDKAHKAGKKIDVHCGGNNDGLRRMTNFDIDTLEHPFYPSFIVDWDIIEKYVANGVFVDTLLQVMLVRSQLAANPHRFNETLYIMSLDPSDYRLLMQYRDRMLWNQRHPDEPALSLYGTGKGRGTYNQQQKGREIARENMRRFIKAGAKFFMGTDTPAFLDFQQEDPDANEMRYMVEMGMTPMDSIVASTRNGAEALGLLDDLGTVEVGKLADVIIVPGNPLLDMNVMKRVCHVIKGGVRYK
jgi:imidazolonepropionase-like amidohydrolase